MGCNCVFVLQRRNYYKGVYMKILSRTEELLLIATWKLQKNAYAVTIREELKAMTGQIWAFGGLFVSLERLAKKGMVDSFLSDPTPERGGRSKRIYRLTSEGLDALIEIRKLQKSIWEDVPKLSHRKLS